MTSESRPVALITGAGRNPRNAVTGLYLTILSRMPTEEELEIVKAYARSGEAKGPKAMLDLAWALINSAEFLYRH